MPAPKTTFCPTGNNKKPFLGTLFSNSFVFRNNFIVPTQQKLFTEKAHNPEKCIFSGNFERRIINSTRLKKIRRGDLRDSEIGFPRQNQTMENKVRIFFTNKFYKNLWSKRWRPKKNQTWPLMLAKRFVPLKFCIVLKLDKTRTSASSL